MFYAQLTNGTVTGITQTQSALPDSPNLVQLESFDESILGYTYADGVFTPPIVQAVEPDTRITAVAFKRRMTQPERSAIRALAKANDVAYDFMDLLDSATVVHLDDADVGHGLSMFEGVGVFAAGRALAILTAPIEPGERP